MSDDDLCIHELGPGQCTVCLHGLRPRQEPVTIDGTFNARYDGDCGGCNLAIVPGQRIHQLSNGRYVHTGCEPEGTEVKR